MPKGTKFVDWTNPQNDAKLLVSVLKHVDVAKHYAEIAQDFGDDIPASCIGLRVAKIKKNVKEGKTLAASSGTAQSKAGGSATMAKLGKVGGVNGKIKKEESGDETSNEGDKSEAGQPDTPPKTPVRNNNADKVLTGRVKKAPVKAKQPPKTKPSDRRRMSSVQTRVSPRKLETKDYKSMVDPFNKMDGITDETGERVFRYEKSDTGDDSDFRDPEFVRYRDHKIKKANVEQENVGQQENIAQVKVEETGDPI